MADPRDYTLFDFIAAPMFVLEVNEAGEPFYAAVNAETRAITGRPLSDYLGKTALEVYPQAFGRRTYAHHCEALASGQSLTYELDLPIGEKLRTVRTTLTPDLTETGKVQRLFAISVDTTREQQALTAKVEFETLSSEMEQFVALAAHDLRAPMRNISLLTDLLREDFEDRGDGKLELLNLLDKITGKSMDLISDVLSHAEAVSPEPDDTIFSFPVLCHHICDTLDPQNEHRFETSLSSLRADRTAMMIALRNLVENAIKHGGRDHLTLNIEITAGMPDMVEVTLSDNGKGFSDAALKIMNGGRFRADSGYGLFGVKRLISARGGTLEARNLANGQGAVVRFSLPGQLVDAATRPQGDLPARILPLSGLLDNGRYSA